MSDATNVRFLADGRQRALEGRERFIEEEVRFRYAERIARAGFIERWRIEAAIRDEVRRRLDEIAPRRALY
ncbi:MAG TPA: hypothetical protein VMW27_17885 [Thermoanaerobaculia bacterium]|nr:hypothetical protein [Thermoanaerobaculia bacterium]